MNNVFKFVLISIVFTIFVSSCKTDEGVLGFAPPPCEPYPECTKLPVMEDEMYSRTGEVLSETPDGNCTIVEEAISAENFDFLPNNFSDKYLGQIFKGTNSIDRSEWAPLLGGVRGSMYGTVVGPTVNEASFLLTPPALHTYNDAINEYKQQEIILDADAQMTYNVLEVNTKEKLKFDLKGGLKIGKWVDIEAGISNSEFEEKNIFVVEMVQEHAEALVSLPNDPKDLFSTWPNANQLGEWSPIMLTGISYGRAAYFIMKSSKSISNSKKTLDAVFKAWGKVKLDIELTAEEENIINSMETQAIIYGGAQAPALGTVGGGVDGIIEYIRSGFLDHKAFGVPMSYKFKYIKDFSDAKVVSNLVYTYRECEELSYSECPMEIIELGPVGGNGGDPFYNSFHKCAKLENIQVRAGARIDKLIFKYRDESDKLHTVSYGEIGGDLMPTIYVNSPIVKITGRAGSRLYGIRFHFADGSSSPSFGAQSGGNVFSFDIENFGGIFGRSHAEIDQFGVLDKKQ